jgi:hypothetical protein
MHKLKYSGPLAIIEYVFHQPITNFMPFLGQKISAIKKQSPEIEIEMEIEH